MKKKKTALFKEFKEFALKGNMIDIAIGVIIGAAFNKVVDVIVKDVFFPPLSLLTGGVNLEGKRIVLRETILENGVVKYEEVAIGYGKLIEVTVDFLIIGLTVFLVVKGMNALRKKAEDPKNEEETTPKDIELLDHIAGLMEKQVELLEDLKKRQDRS
jgi:large conductance mechanosensitive channel